MKTSKVLGGTATSYDRVASLYQVCEGFGAPDDAGFSLTPTMQCAIIAAAAVYAPAVAKEAGAVVKAGVSLGCETGGIASELRSGNWLGAAKSVGCGFFSDIFAASAGFFAAGATSATGPGAVAVGVNTYRALLAGLKLACGGVLTHAATALGVKLETRHETAVALDIIRHSKCLRETKRNVVGIQWSAATCPSSQPIPVPTSNANTLLLDTNHGREQLTFRDIDLFIPGKDGSHAVFGALMNKIGPATCTYTNAGAAPQAYGQVSFYEVRFIKTPGIDWGFYGEFFKSTCSAMRIFGGLTLRSSRWALHTSLGSLHVGQQWANVQGSLKRATSYNTTYGAYLMQYKPRGSCPPLGVNVELEIKLSAGSVDEITVVPPQPC